MEEKIREFKVGSEDDMLANASEINKETSGFDPSGAIMGLALVSAIFGDKSFDEIKKTMEESDKPTTLKSLEKQFKLTTNSLFEIFSMQQKRINELESKIDVIKKSLKG